VDHRAVGRDVDGEFEQQRVVVLHTIEVPAQAERIERGVKNIFLPAHIDRKGRAEVALCGHSPTDDTLMVALRLNVEGRFNAPPLAAKFRIGFDGQFVLCIFGLRFDQVFVSAGLNMEFVGGDSGANGFVRRLRQKFDKEAVAGVEALSIFQSSKAVRQHVVNIEGPKGDWHQHPIVQHSQLLSNPVVELRQRSVITSENLLSPFRSVKSAGFEFSQVEIECSVHNPFAEPSISRGWSESKRREDGQTVD